MGGPFINDKYYDKEGKPICMDMHCKLFADEDYRRIGWDTASENTTISVSTVWLGIGLTFSGGKPLIFESMIFGGDRDGYQQRYSTEAEAIAGHKALVEELTPILGEP